MKSIILLGLILLVFTFSVYAQQNQNEFYQAKFEHYSKMKSKGIKLGIIGGATTAVGIILLNQADQTKYTDSNGDIFYRTEDSSGIVGLGALTTVAGIPITVTGVILGIIGSTKEKKYKGKLSQLSLDVKSNSQLTGLSLIYNF